MNGCSVVLNIEQAAEISPSSGGRKLSVETSRVLGFEQIGDRHVAVERVTRQDSPFGEASLTVLVAAH